MLNDRVGEVESDSRVVTDRRGKALRGNAVRKLFEGSRSARAFATCGHMLRHTWATNFHPSGSGSKFGMQVEGGWTTGRMVEQYCKASPLRCVRRRLAVARGFAEGELEIRVGAARLQHVSVISSRGDGVKAEL